MWDSATLVNMPPDTSQKLYNSVEGQEDEVKIKPKSLRDELWELDRFYKLGNLGDTMSK